MNILGINEGHMSSACLIKNGILVAAACEERFTRNKNEQGYPENAIDYCLNEGKIHSSEIDYVSSATLELDAALEATKRYKNFSIADYIKENNQYWRPKLLENKEIDYFELFPIQNNDNYDFSFLNSSQNKVFVENQNWSQLFKNERKKNIQKKLNIDEKKIFFVDHHTGHAFYAYFMSPFRKNVIVLTADAWGDGCNCSIWIGNENKLELKFKSPNNSLARLYRNMTLLLGMKPNEHEFKVMGLAPYATEYQLKNAYEIFKRTLYVDDLDFLYKEKPTDNYFWYKERLEGCRFDGIAGGLQKFTEEIMENWVQNIIKKFKYSNIVFSGGLSLNIKVNKVISEIHDVKNFFVPSGGGDESQSIGSALYLLHSLQKEFTQNSHDYLGPSIENSSVELLIDKLQLEKNFKIIYKIKNKEIAEFLKNDLIVGRCCDRSEFGPRALGNRSILANPSNIKNLTKINNQIKFRDFWMPFTPSILIERVDDYIKNPKKIISPFMTIAFDSTDLAKKELVAAIHPADETIRPQFVDKKTNSNYHELISNFETISGIGALLNTSLNLHGEPVVGNALDAIKTFKESELDVLIINNTCIMRK